MGQGLTIYGYGGVDELFDLSPFVHKLEAYLRLADVAHEKVAGDPRRSPNRKLPCLRHADRTLGDSQAIIEYLRAAGIADLDDWLDRRQRALASTLRMVLEEDLYFTLVYFRWQDETGWSTYREVLVEVLRAAGVPRILTGIIAGRLRAGVVRKLDEQGAGRRRRAELEARAAEQLENLAILCEGGSPWLLGERPCTLDAVAHAFLAGIRWTRVATPLAERLAEHAALVRWLDHADARLTG
jgi:glutathione S-transferase